MDGAFNNRTLNTGGHRFLDFYSASVRTKKTPEMVLYASQDKQVTFVHKCWLVSFIILWQMLVRFLRWQVEVPTLLLLFKGD